MKVAKHQNKGMERFGFSISEDLQDKWKKPDLPLKLAFH